MKYMIYLIKNVTKTIALYNKYILIKKNTHTCIKMLPLKNIMSDQEAAESGADDEFHSEWTASSGSRVVL